MVGSPRHGDARHGKGRVNRAIIAPCSSTRGGEPMNDALYGVLFRDQGVQEYLVFADENEEAAIDEARRRDEKAFDDAVEKHADESDEFAEPVWEDYDGMFYVQPVTRQLAEDAEEMLARNMAVQL